MPLYLQLYHALKNDIERIIQPGTKLPSIRQMAQEQCISKNGVEQAYKQLELEGYIESRPKSGYFVVSNIKKLIVDADKKFDFVVSEPLCTTIEYDFSPTQLTHDSFPLKTWKRLTSKAFNLIDGLGKYTDGLGEYTLREEIASYLRHSRNVQCNASNVIVCSGFTDGMNLIAGLLGNDFSKIGIEQPGYQVTQEIFTHHHFNIVPIALTHQGLCLESLKNSGVRLVYITPTHQYPTGVSMPISHRFALLEWAKNVNGIIIEDDYDSELRYYSRPIPSLQGLDHYENVIYIGTFSKALSPALRISYIVLPARYITRYKTLKLSRYPHVSLPLQKTLELFIADGHWVRHLKKIKIVNKKKHHTLKEILKNDFEPFFEILSDGGGLAIVIQPKSSLNIQLLKELAYDAKIKLYFMRDLYGHELESIRLGFGGLTEDKIIEGMKRLKAICCQAKHGSHQFIM
ncbi:MAG: hypothetical protein OA34_12970 [Sulfurospirillum sp. MES]|nr:MAG: hypothetical protein OA34_12970 [Sulfurospirillum sp. MES]